MPVRIIEALRQVLKSHLTKHTIFGVMRTYNEIELIEALQSLQIVEGDVLYVSSSLFELGHSRCFSIKPNYVNSA